jgi:hypothetical protein
MPTQQCPVTVASPIADLVLRLNIVYTGNPLNDIDQILDITIVNGEALQVLPYNYNGGGPN